MSECLICDILLDSVSTLSKHNLDYHGIAEIKETFKCTVCLEEFEAEDTLFMHFKAKHVSREVKTTKETEAINSEDCTNADSHAVDIEVIFFLQLRQFVTQQVCRKPITSIEGEIITLKKLLEQSKVLKSEPFHPVAGNADCRQPRLGD